MIDTTYIIKKTEICVEDEYMVEGLEESIKQSMEIQMLKNKRISYDLKRETPKSVTIRILDLGLSTN